MATTTSDTATIIMNDKPSHQEGGILRFIGIAVIVACIVSIAALICAVVGVSKQRSIVVGTSGGGDSAGGGDTYVISSGSSGIGSNDGDGDKIWRFQIGHFGANTQYLDEQSGQIRGYDVDVVNKVCQIANKNCVIVWDVYENCWRSQAGQRPRGGIGLMGDYYDACIGWVQTRERKRTMDFSNQIAKSYPVTLIVKKGGSIGSYPNLSNLKIGFLDGWYADEYCLTRYAAVTGFDQTDANFVVHFVSEPDLVKALKDGTIDAAFVPQVPYILEHTDIEQYQAAASDFTENHCIISGVSIMLPKAKTGLNTWFNPAFERLIGTREYDGICQDLTIAHGDQPGYTPDKYCVV